jgi:NAD(P)-dependent dehydrogenase (short-subunit alcohol dehydrogenase family)
VNGFFSLVGSRAIVTGASQGLGREIARHFLGAGADVVICARTAADIESAARELKLEFPLRRIVAQVCDIGRTEDIDELYRITLQALGGLEVVVNNAGIHGPIAPLEEADWTAWERAVAVNLLGTAYSCRRAIAHFKKHPQSGRRVKIINLSGGGATTPQPGLSAYGATKAAIVRLTETLAGEVADFGIDVYAVAPGALATRLMAELIAAGPERIGTKYFSRLEELYAEGGMPMDRAAQFCCYLASAESDGLSGRLLSAAWDPWPFKLQSFKEIMSTDIFTLRRINPEDRGYDLKKHK